MADLLDLTARQVRLPGATVHKLRSASTGATGGRVYRTLCGRELPASAGAVLTTHEVGCQLCEEAGKPSRVEAGGTRG